MFNRKCIAKLPDKGVKLQLSINRIKEALDSKKEDVDAAVEMFSKASISDNFSPSVVDGDELELNDFLGRIINTGRPEKAVASEGSGNCYARIMSKSNDRPADRFRPNRYSNVTIYNMCHIILCLN